MNRVNEFEQHRPKLFGLAYRMLGSRVEAQDVVQDAFLRWRETNVASVRSSEAWLKTIVTRLSIDRLRRLKLERETYVGPWLPEPISERDVSSPELAAELDGDISIAFLTLLETLGPEERAAFVLHDVMDDDYVDIAEALGKSEAACRQLVHRARERVNSRRRRFHVDNATRERMLERFMAVVTKGDRKEIVALFAADAVHTSDGGGKNIAVLRMLHGAERISWLWHVIARSKSRKPERRMVWINGEPGIAVYWSGRLHSVSTIETDGEVIHAYFSIANPDKLTSFAEPDQLMRLDWPAGRY